MKMVKGVLRVLTGFILQYIGISEDCQKLEKPNTDVLGKRG